MKHIPYLLMTVLLATACSGSNAFKADNTDAGEKKTSQPNVPVTTTSTTTTSTSTTIASTTTTLPPGACAPTPAVIPGGTIVINDGAAATKSLTVNLKLGREGETGKMKISNNANCECGTWERFNENKVWTLPTANASNTISVQYKNFEGAGSQCVKAVIIHDTLGPVIQLALNAGNSYWAGDDTGLQSNIFDSGSGVQSAICKLNGSPTTCALGLNEILFQRQKIGTYTYDVVATDVLGNSSTGSISWEMKEKPTLAPEIKLALDTGNTYLSDSDTKLKLDVNDMGDGVRNLVCKLNSVVTGCVVGLNNLVFSRQTAGNYLFEVSATNVVGKPASNSISWEVKPRPTFAPLIRLALDASNTFWNTDDTKLKLEVLDQGDGVTNLVCKLNGAVTACSVGVNNLVFSKQAIGHYFFEVSATNNFGKPAIGSIQWDIIQRPDAAPAIKLYLDPTNTYLSGDNTKLNLEVIDQGFGVANLVCKLNGASTACTAGVNNLVFPKQALGDYRFEVSATSNFGKPASDFITWTITQKILDIQQNVEIKSNNKVDILIVDDNSASMQFEQKNMAARMSTFLNQLSGLDWRIAITTTDPVHTTWGDGRLLAMKGLTNQYMITSSTPAQQAQKVLGDTIQRSETGNSSEQGIYATYRSVERSLAAANSPNKTFFRNDANFATIVISDEDESAKGVKNIPENLLSFLKTTWSSKLFAFHSIITKPGDKKCLYTEGATYGAIYQKLSLLTGAGTVGGAIIGSVCETDYGSQLRGIGDSVQEMQRIMNLQCAPMGPSNSAVVVTLNGVNFTAPYEVQGLKLVFNTNLPKGQYVLQYRCNQ
jgi:hypothetical protein